MNETFETMTVGTFDPCPTCLRFASEGYAEWYEEIPVSVIPTAIVAAPVLPPIPAVPEPSVWVLLLLGLLLVSRRRT